MPLRPQVLHPGHARQHPALTGGNVAILSADNPRYPASVEGEEAFRQEMERRVPAPMMEGEDNLRQELERLGLDYEITKGKYGAPERSFIVHNPDLNQVLDLGRRFGQESVAYSENGRHQLHYVNGPNAGMATVPAEQHEWHDEEPQDNYTAVPDANGNPLGYFTWNIDFNSPMVPSKPTPMTQQQVQPLAMSEKPLIAEVRAWMERLGELRTRELAKAEPTDSDAYFHPSDSSAKKPAPAGPPAVNTYRAVPKDYRKAEGDATANALNPDKTMREGSQVNIEPSALKKPVWKPIGTAMKAEPSANEYSKGKKCASCARPIKDKDIPEAGNYCRYGCSHHTQVRSQSGPAGNVAAVTKAEAQSAGQAYAPKPIPVNGDTAGLGHANVDVLAHGMARQVVHEALKRGAAKRLTKSIESETRDSVRRVRDAEDRELAGIPLRDTSKPVRSFPGKVPNIAEEREMSKSEHSKVDPLDADIAKQRACPGCKTPQSPVVAALRKAKGGMCLKCEAGGMMKAEGEKKLTYVNNEPQREAQGWEVSCEEPYKAPGSGGDKKKESVGTSANPGAKSTTFPMGKAEGMPVPAAPKPPQAPGAAPVKAGGTGPMQKGEWGRRLATAATVGAMALGAGKAQAAVPNAPDVNLAAMKRDVPLPATPQLPVYRGETAKTRVAPPVPQVQTRPQFVQPIRKDEEIGKPLSKPPVSQAQRGAMYAAAAGKSTLGIPKKVGEEFTAKDPGGKLPKHVKKSELDALQALHKALSFGGAPATPAGGMRQASFEAKAKQPVAGTSTTERAVPKPPGEYDAAAFRPASPGAAGAPTLPPKPVSAQPVVKQGQPIASLRGIRGAPLPKPRV